MLVFESLHCPNLRWGVGDKRLPSKTPKPLWGRLALSQAKPPWERPGNALDHPPSAPLPVHLQSFEDRQFALLLARHQELAWSAVGVTQDWQKRILCARKIMAIRSLEIRYSWYLFYCSEELPTLFGMRYPWDFVSSCCWNSARKYQSTKACIK